MNAINMNGMNALDPIDWGAVLENSHGFFHDRGREDEFVWEVYPRIFVRMAETDPGALDGQNYTEEGLDSWDPAFVKAVWEFTDAQATWLASAGYGALSRKWNRDAQELEWHLDEIYSKEDGDDSRYWEA